ncbi:MAG: HNH endonuclease [Blastocatellia bacterium]
MPVSAQTRNQVRQRAGFACEYCGVSETDVGSELTIDHFQPQSKGGDDRLENLIYCCTRCNEYKGSYWPEQLDEQTLWNPRNEPASLHFVADENGTLNPLTSTGALTIRLLHLNRQPLIDYRLKARLQSRQTELLNSYRGFMQLSADLLARQAELLNEQQEVLLRQQSLLEKLLSIPTNDEHE